MESQSEINHDRFEKLRLLSNLLTEKEEKYFSKLKCSQWIFDQMSELRKLARSDNCTVELLKIKIESIFEESVKMRGKE